MQIIRTILNVYMSLAKGIYRSVINILHFVLMETRQFVDK